MNWFERVKEDFKHLIGVIYDWVVFTLLCRKDYFTHQLSRMLVKHGVFFWGAFLTGCVWLSKYVLIGAVWQKLLAGGGLFFMAWLTDHLIDTVRNNPEYSDHHDKE